MSRLGKISFVFAVISLICFFIAKFILKEWMPFLWVVLGLFALFIAAAIYVDRRMYMEFFTLKTTKQGMNMGVMILLFLSIIIMVNWLGSQKIKTWDFSSQQKNSLSEQSQQVLRSLDSELKVLFFYKQGQEEGEQNKVAFRELIKKYQDQSSKVSLDFVEVNERPDLTKEFGVDKGSGVVFVSYKGRKNRIDKIDEQELTNALIKVAQEKQKTVYFTKGHGEYSLDESKEARGAFQLKTLLENNNYLLKTWTMNLETAVPTDADMVLVIGPKQNFLDFEVKLLEEYLSGGGHLVLALKSEATSGLDKIIQQIGYKAANNYVLNVINIGVAQTADPRTPTFGNIFSTENPITKVFTGGEVSLLFRPMSFIKSGTTSPSITVDEIIKTNQDSMAFQDLTFKNQLGRGPHTLALSATGSWPGSKEAGKNFQLVVFGDADFLNNQLIYQNLNRDLILNTVAYMGGQNQLISITPKDVSKTEIDPSTIKQGLFYFGVAIPLPLLMLISSLTLWFRRRHS